MSTRQSFERSEIKKDSPYFSRLRTVIETAFYGNHVKPVTFVAEAYHLAKESPATTLTDMTVKHPEELGLPNKAKVLVENGGGIVGRTAAARRILGNDPEEDEKLEPIIREAIYQGKKNKRYKTSAYVGLDKDFMVKAHLSVPEGQENNMYSWLLNFQPVTSEYEKMYDESLELKQSDIYIYQDPNWSHPDYPLGLAYFDPDHNAAIILGLNYFGELKKGTLTLAWNIANQSNFASSHGGQKLFERKNGSNFVASFFGLSGSGKSTLTHAKHDDQFAVKVLHDDAFIISLDDGSSIALEPSYFDKTNDYPIDHPETDYFLTVQNVGVTLDNNGEKVLLTEDLRNGNGRTVKSRYSTSNRVDKFNEPINAIFWIMKDDSLPPLLKVDDPTLAATFGATLATKRTSAERVEKGTNMDELVIEPFANPFRVYPLREDYKHFKELFEENETDCYIINTGAFLDKDIPKEVTLGVIEAVVRDDVTYQEFALFENTTFANIDGFNPDFKDSSYLTLVKDRIQMRINFIEKQNKGDTFNHYPKEAAESLEKLIKQ